MIVNVTQFHVVMPLHSYHKPQATFPSMPETYELELHPSSIIKIESYRFQIGCIKNLAAVVIQNYLIAFILTSKKSNLESFKFENVISSMRLSELHDVLHYFLKSYTRCQLQLQRRCRR